MNASFLAAAARDAVRILLWQVGCIAVGAVAAGALWGVRVGWSVLAGGGIGLIWTIYMALTFYHHGLVAKVRPDKAGLGVGSFLLGWLIKVSLTISLLVIAFRSKALVAPALLAGVGLALLAYWVWLAFVRVKHANSADGK